MLTHLEVPAIRQCAYFLPVACVLPAAAAAAAHENNGSHIPAGQLQ
jgi:hypothetical protein